mmetsp:Transcript_40924/g.60646  ORF Transcript_40924/g.60646 Transcript_40924/m.60646 type:complete len:102 (-) Transcript_40924:1260-1565(-)
MDGFLDVESLDMDLATKKWVYEGLLKKTFHSRAGATFDKYKEDHTSRQSKGTDDVALRARLQVLTTKATVENNSKVKGSKMRRRETESKSTDARNKRLKHG